MAPITYVSTRGAAPELGFADVLLAGLAIDGGLYVPSQWPSLTVGAFERFESFDVQIERLAAGSGTSARNRIDGLHQERFNGLWFFVVVVRCNGMHNRR